VSLIGLTYGNYDAELILDLLTEIAGTNSYIYFDIQLLERIDIDMLINIYKVNTRFACFEKLKLLGLSTVNIDDELVVDGCIEIKYKVTALSNFLTSHKVCIGDTICLFKSLRKNKLELENDLKKYRSIVFDTKHSIISVLITT